MGGYCHIGRAGQGSFGSCGFRQLGSLSNLGGLPCFGVCGDRLMTVFVDGKPVGFEGGLLELEWGCKGEGDLRVLYIYMQPHTSMQRCQSVANPRALLTRQATDVRR